MPSHLHHHQKIHNYFHHHKTKAPIISIKENLRLLKQEGNKEMQKYLVYYCQYQCEECIY